MSKGEGTEEQEHALTAAPDGCTLGSEGGMTEGK